jgi:hypothetical protein
MRLTATAVQSHFRDGKLSTFMLMAFGFAVLSCCGIGGFLAMQSTKAKHEALDEADRLYDKSPTQAVEKYKEGYSVAGSRKGEVLQRIVEQEVKSGTTAEAKKWVEKGVDDGVTVSYTSQAAKDLLVKVQKDRAEQLAAKPVEKDKKVKERDTKNRKYTRDEFKQLVLGKTRDEVIGLLGKPNATQESGDLELWNYYSRTTDPTTGKTDQDAQVEFQNGRVENVTFIRV